MYATLAVKAGVNMKMSGKSDFFFLWNWQVQLLDFTLVRVVLGYFQNLNEN